MEISERLKEELSSKGMFLDKPYESLSLTDIWDYLLDKGVFVNIIMYSDSEIFASYKKKNFGVSSERKIPNTESPSPSQTLEEGIIYAVKNLI